jgi:hypothetical protein
MYPRFRISNLRKTWGPAVRPSGPATIVVDVDGVHNSHGREIFFLCRLAGSLPFTSEVE